MKVPTRKGDNLQIISFWKIGNLRWADCRADNV